MAGTADVMEGFLCPLCMKDFGTVTQLQEHFEVAHTSEDKAVFQHLKGFFDKAKKRILGDKDLLGFSSPFGGQREDDSSYFAASSVMGYDPSWWEPQELGVIRSHIETFKAKRDARVDHFVVETNKLLIRLDKLIADDAPTEPSKRKAFEKSVVPWIPDSEVPACLSCARSFSLRRRRHHCRICGGIICYHCSQFLTFSYAQKLVNPAFSFQGEGFLKRTNSNSSLNSLVGPDGEQHMRICDVCRRLLERRDKMTEQRNSKPNIVLLYDKMKTCIDDAQELLTRYMPMVESLSNGESTYNYRQAQILRAKLSKMYEIIDQLSKKILILNLDAEPPPNPKELYLQKSIRIYASNFMQENLMGLQALPSEEEYTRMQESRKEKIQQQIAVERLAAMEAQEKERRNEEPEKPGKSPTDSVKQLGHRRSDSSDSVGKGWKPAEVVAKADDPMLQQIEIIRGYVRQAREAKKWDEVEMLEQNLKEIQQEYLRQQGHSFKS
ncbi:rabenosyn-5-like [Gigantopelta aegis]|uniref:rabenosyn-5-like n=1 Tax=Gigantopelta aegis TaxID=1735272 RepID=UPI001B8893E4|nr:rabenosyn-5-like [Gigantopelta aegis]